MNIKKQTLIPKMILENGFWLLFINNSCWNDENEFEKYKNVCKGANCGKVSESVLLN